MMHPLTRRATILGAAPFDPRSIAGLKLWLAADRISGLADGDTVGTWSDLSGLGNNATQATGSKKPLYKVGIVNGKPVIRFDGVDDFLAFPSIALGGFSIFLAGNISDFSAARCLFGSSNFGGGSASTILIRFSNSSTFQARGDAATLATITVTTDTSTHIYEIRNQAGAVSLLADGVSKGSGTTDTTFTLTDLGQRNAADSFYKGDMGEVLLYTPVLTTAQAKQVRSYLGAKYGITVS